MHLWDFVSDLLCYSLFFCGFHTKFIEKLVEIGARYRYTNIDAITTKRKEIGSCIV